MILYKAHYNDPTGYGEAARNYILALDRLQVAVKIVNLDKDPLPPAGMPLAGPPRTGRHPVLFEGFEPSRARLEAAETVPEIQIMHSVPDFWIDEYSPKLYNIGYVVWEMDSLPEAWIRIANRYCDEIWTSSKWNADVLKRSGIDKPITVIPHCLDIEFIQSAAKTPIIELEKLGSVLVFGMDAFPSYRKNIEGLVKAFLIAFSGKMSCKTVLLLRIPTDGSQEAHNVIIGSIKKVIDSVTLSSKPRIIVLAGKHLSQKTLFGIYKNFDWYVSLSRGEAWNIPAHIAMASSVPAILSDLPCYDSVPALRVSCRDEYLTDYRTAFGHLSSMVWKEPSIHEAVQVLRTAFDMDRSDLGAKARNYASGLSLEWVGSFMLKRLNEIRAKHG